LLLSGASDSRRLPFEGKPVKPPTLSQQFDTALIAELDLIQRGCLVLAALIGGVALAAWLVHPLDRYLPSSWLLIKANTAVAMLLSVLSLELSRDGQPGRRRRLASCVLAVLVGLLSSITGAEYIFHVSLGVDTLLSTDPSLLQPGRMSPEAALAFVLLSLVMILIPLRKRYLVYVADFYVCGLCLLLLVVGSGYMFRAMHLFGLSGSNLTAPQTLVGLMLLSFVVFGRQAQQGIFGILLGVGIASRIARVVLPIALLLPFLLEAAKSIAIRTGLVDPEFATAIATALGMAVAFGLILVLAWRIDKLESSIRDLSLRDELTGLYNRRGFYVLAEQALRLAQRSGKTLSVLFIDVDDLKQINDRHGHEVGSSLLNEVAEFLKESFRRTDVIGRIGGDEFAVAGVSSEAAMNIALERLERSTAERNAQHGRLHPFSFSIGHVTSEVSGSESLEELLGKADGLMYETKRRKKLLLSESKSVIKAARP